MSKKSLYKGSLTTIILSLLEQESKMYGYEITQKVKELTHGAIQIKEGALYPALHKLQAEGHLKVEAVQVDHRIRKYYSLTPSGYQESKSQVQSLKEYMQSMEQLIFPKIQWQS